MSNSGGVSQSGAYRQVNTDSLDVGGDEAPAAAPATQDAKPAPAQIGPMTGGFSGDPGASILQAQLADLDLQAAAIEDEQDALVDQALSADAPATIDATLDRMDELQARLDALYQERDNLEAMLDDPNSDEWDT